MKIYNCCLEALNDFVKQRSGIDRRDYYNHDGYMGDYRPMIQQGRDFFKMSQFVSGLAVTDTDFVKASEMAFSGRLSFDFIKDGEGLAEGHDSKGYKNSGVSYCTGQYFPTEYRLAACCVIAKVIKDYWLDCGYDWAEVKRKAKETFGRGIASRYFD